MGCLSSIAAPGKYLQYEGLLNHAWIDWPSSHSMLWLAKCMVYESTWTNFSCILMSTLISSLAPPAWHPIFPIFVVISIHVLLRCHIYISIDFLSLCFLCWFHDERGLRLLFLTVAIKMGVIAQLRITWAKGEKHIFNVFWTGGLTMVSKGTEGVLVWGGWATIGTEKKGGRLFFLHYVLC